MPEIDLMGDLIVGATALLGLLSFALVGLFDA